MSGDAVSPLVERVAEVLDPGCMAVWDRKRDALAKARAVLEACHAEQMQDLLQRLLVAMGGLPVLILTGELVDAIADSRELLAKLERRS